MQNDEEEIRQLVATWAAATRAQDLDTVLSLMADDIVLLLPGRPPMTKAEFSAEARKQSRERRGHFEQSIEIREIKVLGDWAFMWTELKGVAKPRGSVRSIKFVGPTLAILKKEDGKWVLARDANLAVPM